MVEVWRTHHIYTSYNHTSHICFSIFTRLNKLIIKKKLVDRSKFNVLYVLNSFVIGLSVTYLLIFLNAKYQVCCILNF